MSQVVAGMRQPGNTQVVARVSMWRRWVAVGRRLVMSVTMVDPVAGSVTV
jgi:hypothetical protein